MHQCVREILFMKRTSVPCIEIGLFLCETLGYVISAYVKNVWRTCKNYETTCLIAKHASQIVANWVNLDPKAHRRVIT